MKGINEPFIRNIPKLSGINEQKVHKQPVRAIDFWCKIGYRLLFIPDITCCRR